MDNKDPKSDRSQEIDRNDEICIEGLLSTRQLYHALVLIRKLIAKYPQDGRSDRYHSIENNYRFLMDYFLSGGNDPQRESIIDQLVVEAYKLFDEIEYDKNRNNPLRQQLLQHLQEQHTGYFSCGRDTFYHFLLMQDVSALTAEWDNLVEREDYESLQMAVSALTLNILSDFSESLFLFLLEKADFANEDIANRVLVGCVLLIHRYDGRIAFFPAISSRWQLIAADAHKKEVVLQICMHLLSTTLTHQVDQVMNSLQKDITSQQKNIKKDGKTYLINLSDLEEGNPAWSKELNEMVSKHSETIMHLHKIGADINYGSTQMFLKHPFFQTEITNWFIPFSTDNPNLGIDFESAKGKLLQKLVYINADACPIDQYATCLMIGSSINSLLENILPEEIAEMSEADIAMLSKHADAANGIVQYIRNLFRFFNNNPWEYRNEMLSIANVCRMKTLYSCMEGSLESIGDYCLELKLYSEAEEIFLHPTLSPSIHLWQKAGYALQKQEEYEEARKMFEKVLSLQDDDEWTLHHIATCCMKEKMHEKALSYYERLCALKPDKPKYIFLQAQCLTTLKRYEEALQLFFKLDIVAPEETNHKRGLGWCALMLGKVDISLRYLEDVALSKEATKRDYMNYAHSLLANNRRAEAVKYYRKSQIFNFLQPEGTDLYFDFDNDTDVLVKKGLITREELSLISDCLYEELEK